MLLHPHIHAFMTALLGVALTSALGYGVAPWLGTSGLAMGYLLLMLLASLYLSFFGALSTAVLSFFALNFFFVEPRCTLQVRKP